MNLNQTSLHPYINFMLETNYPAQRSKLAYMQPISIVVSENVLVLESLHALVLEVIHYRVMHAQNKTDP